MPRIGTSAPEIPRRQLRLATIKPNGQGLMTTTTKEKAPGRESSAFPIAVGFRETSADDRERLAPRILSEFPVSSPLPAHIQSLASLNNPAQHKLLTIQDLADLLSIPILTIYQWRSKHTGPRAMRIGRHLRWDAREVAAWLLTQLDDWDADYEVVA